VPLQKLQFKPGLNRDQTNYSNEGGWYECDKIRFRSGYPQKVGGWLRYSTFNIIGICRQVFNWITTSSNNFLALGTSRKVFIEEGTSLYDITPIRAIYTTSSVGHDTDNCFTTANGSKTVRVEIQNHGADDGSYVTFSGVVGSGGPPTTIGGIPTTEFNKEFVITFLNSDEFTITMDTPATSTVANAGGTAIVAAFQINIGNDVSIIGYGWGAGQWSTGGWGLSATGAPVVLIQRDWWFDNFDDDLVMNARNGGIYYWKFSDGVTARATVLSATTIDGIPPADVPDQAMQILVSQNDKHLLAFGCTPFGLPGQFDPLLIRWATQDQPNVWTPLVTNSAGFLRVSRGSQIVRAVATRQEVLVFTEGTLSSLQYLGTTDVFGIQELADSISILSPRGVAVVNNVTYWMGHDKFYAYSGRVETLPCTLRNHIFQNLNYSQADQIVCGTNEGWNEIWWFYPTATSNVNDAYIVYNHLEKIWYYGSIHRTAWIDSSLRDYPQGINPTVFTGSILGQTLTVTGITIGKIEVGTLLTGNGIATGTLVTAFGTGTGGIGTYTINIAQNIIESPITSNGLAYDHERGLNDNELPMQSYIASSDFDLVDGDQFILTKRIIPDISFAGSTATTPEVTMYVKPRNFPGNNYTNTESGPVIETSIDVYTDQIFMRARARQMAIEIESTELNVQWQLGSPRLDGRPDGKR
jgi:hypothetical protein